MGDLKGGTCAGVCEKKGYKQKEKTDASRYGTKKNEFRPPVLTWGGGGNSVSQKGGARALDVA